ncbi:hypothetical protein GCM10009757_40750 [Streptomyces cheonanensis]|uniref:Uncharacterized protein n=1 Tax=Streptomyces cheonanensis TaxID=312720 RepID=A0ABN2VD08_9ACTN|nr:MULTISPECIES: hypothetical protein [Streptomyces]
MQYRAVLLALFLIPALWGASSVGNALTVSDEVVCPGENVRGGEEHPGPMRPGDTECSVLDGSVAVATRSYTQQQRVQDLERRRDAVNGFLLLAYGTAGTLASWFATRPRAPRD